MSAEELAARIARAEIAAPRAEAVLVDLAGDPPLGASARAIAIEDAARVVDGIGAAMVAARAGRGVVAVPDAASQQALLAALQQRKAGAVEVVIAADVWPSTGIDRDLGCEGAWVLDGERLLDLESAAFGRPRAPRRITVAGWVARPGVVAATAPLTVEQAVAAAGGALGEAWVALDGGPWGGRIGDREEPVRSSLLVALPAADPRIARARTSVVDQLRRVASACEGCRACSDVCPVALDGTPLAPHAIVAALAQDTDPGPHVAAAVRCVGCGVCDAACPVGLSPFALVGSVRDRLPPGLPSASRGPAHPDRGARRMARELLIARAGSMSWMPGSSPEASAAAPSAE